MYLCLELMKSPPWKTLQNIRVGNDEHQDFKSVVISLMRRAGLIFNGLIFNNMLLQCKLVLGLCGKDLVGGSYMTGL